MPQIKITLDQKTYDEIKKLAEGDERSTTQYISRLLRQTAGTLILPQSPVFYPATTPSTIPTPPFIPVAQDQTVNPLDPDYSVPTVIGGRRVKSIIFEKEHTEEEKKLQEIKIQKQENKILEKREQKWFEKAKEVLSGYASDESCRHFAHNHIYREQLLP